jgi:hypothetical protein
MHCAYSIAASRGSADAGFVFDGDAPAPGAHPTSSTIQSTANTLADARTDGRLNPLVTSRTPR